MTHQLLRRHPSGNTYLLVFDTDDDVMPLLLQWVRDTAVHGAAFTGIGAFRRAVVGYFDLERRDYDRVDIDEQVEVLTLAGNIARKGDEPKVHAHVVLGKRDGTAHGGHLLDATVRPTLELVVVEAQSDMCRSIDEQTGLPLLVPSSR